jgi:integrase
MYERLVFKHIIPAIGNKKLKDLLKSDIQEMINNRAAHIRTCQQLRMASKQMLNSAMENGLIYRNVALNISLPTNIKQKKRGLTDAEKEAIKKTNFTDREKAFIYVLMCTGVRRGEALALSRMDIDFKKKIIKIRNSITFNGSEPILKPFLKTEAGFRDLPITAELESVLKPYVDNLKSLYLFERIDGGLMPKSTYDDFWKYIVDRINVTAGGTPLVKTKEKQPDGTYKYKDIKGLQVIHGLTAHVFRHNYCTSLYYADVKLQDAQHLMGHANMQITSDIYTHLDEQKILKSENLLKISILN